MKDRMDVYEFEALCHSVSTLDPSQMHLTEVRLSRPYGYRSKFHQDLTNRQHRRLCDFDLVSCLSSVLRKNCI